MSDNKLKVLLIEDSLGDIRLISDMIEESGLNQFELNHNIKLSSGLERLKQNKYDVILLDLNLPDSMGLNSLIKVRSEYKDIPIVVITELVSREMELDVVRHGAQDFLIKGHFEDNLLLKTLRYAVERKREEKRIIETTRLLEIIFNSTHMLLAYIDTGFNFVKVNQAYANAEQKDVTFFPGKNYFELYPNEEIKNKFNAVLKTGEPYFAYSGEDFKKNDNKEITYWDFSIIPVKDNEDQAIGIVLTLSDVTDRVLSELKIKESEERFRLMADTAPILIWMSGTDKLCTYFNKGWLEFTGKTLEQQTGNRWAEGVHPDDLDYCIKVYNEAFDARENFQMEYRLKRYDNEYRWIFDKGSPRINPDGTFMGYIGSCIDITERKKTEEDLSISNARFDGMIRSAMDSIISINAEQKIILFNDAAEKTFGISTAEAIGKDINNFVPMKSREVHKKHIANFGETNVSTRSMGNLGTLNAQRADGTIFPIEASISQVDVAGEKIYTVIIRDISNRNNHVARTDNAQYNYPEDPAKGK